MTSDHPSAVRHHKWILLLALAWAVLCEQAQIGREEVKRQPAAFGKMGANVAEAGAEGGEMLFRDVIQQRGVAS